MKRRILFSVLCVLAAAGAFAQEQGLAGINEATSLMTSYFDPATKLCYPLEPYSVWSAVSRRMASSAAVTRIRPRLRQAGSSPASS